LEYAKSVIGLDGTPLTIDSDEFVSNAPEWSNAVGVNFRHEKILTNEERADYIANTLNHTYINTAPGLKPYSSGRYNDPIEDEIVLREITEKYGNGSPPVVTTSKKVADEYEQLGFKSKGIADEFEYPGNLRGTNEYADTRLAAQLGSTHHGDFEVARRAAWLGETIDPEGRGRDRDYGSEIGNKVVEQMREQQTLQNVLRFGRDGGGATIILHTSAYPDWLPVAGEGSISPWNDGMKQIAEAWQDLADEGVTTQDVAEHDAVDVTERTVLSNLHQLSDELGLLECEDDPDDGRRNLWNDDGLSGVERHDQASVEMPELDDEELDEMGLLDDDGEVIADEMEISRYSINTSDFRFYGGVTGGVSGAGDTPGETSGSSGGSGGGTGVSGGLEE
jgi:hypothetical protein